MFFSHGSSHTSGVMIPAGPNLDLKLENCISDRDGFSVEY